MNKILTILSAICALAISSVSIAAQGLIRDAEIETSLKRIAAPILQKAGVGANTIKFYVVNDRSMNAYVAGGRNIFIHHGLITRLENVEQLQAVIAHEVAHITGGHLAQRSADFQRARTAAGLGLILSAAAAAAGSGEAALGIAAGSQSASQRAFLTHTRAQEASADQAGVRYMAAAGIDPKAALKVFELFQGQDLLTANRRDPYTLTHPLNSARMASIRGFANSYKVKPAPKNNSQYWYSRMKAKFIGFIGNPTSTLRRIKKSDTSEVATYTRAIAYHNKPDRKRAAAEISKLLKIRPNDPYYNELNGQFQLENGNTANSITAYKKAVSLAPKEPQLLAGLGRAYIAAKNYKAALSVLKKSYARDGKDGRMLRDLALAYAKTGNAGWASVVTAERYALSGNFKVASNHAKRAQGLLGKGTTGWLKAEDVLIYAKRSKRKK